MDMNDDDDLKNDDHYETVQGYTHMETKSAEDYYKQYVPGYGNDNNNANSSNQLMTGNDELLKKLDNILHLLEEQSDEKTNYIMEELILYVFLGIFCNLCHRLLC